MKESHLLAFLESQLSNAEVLQCLMRTALVVPADLSGNGPLADRKELKLVSQTHSSLRLRSQRSVRPFCSGV